MLAPLAWIGTRLSFLSPGNGWVVRLQRAMRRATSISSLIAFAALAIAGGAHGACEIPPQVRLSPPTVDGKPVKVTVDFTLVDLIAIKDAQQLFTADLVLSMNWHDPRLSVAARGTSLEGCRFGRADVWHPDIGSINRLALTFIFGPRVTVDSDGHVHSEVRGFGDFSSSLNLREFPFDRQDLRVQMTSFKYGPKELELVGQQTERSTITAFTLSGWKFLRSYTDTRMAPAKAGAQRFSHIDFVLEVQRKPGYYIWNFVVPLVFIVLMAWAVFWLDPQAAGVQIGISTASVFTLVAFLIALRGRLPPLDYLTRMDELILCSTALVFAALAEAVLTSRLAQNGEQALAVRIDAYARWVYLATFGMVLYVTLLR